MSNKLKANRVNRPCLHTSVEKIGMSYLGNTLYWCKFCGAHKVDGARWVNPRKKVELIGEGKR